jgi:hypothetical protein
MIGPVAKWHRADQLIALQKQSYQSCQIAEEQRNGSGQLIFAKVQTPQCHQSAEGRRNSSVQLSFSHNSFSAISAPRDDGMVPDNWLLTIDKNVRPVNSPKSVGIHP